MELIVLKGKENTGKTTTINYVYNELRGNRYEEPNQDKFENLKKGDFLAILEKEGIKLGINSQGDEVNQIQKYLGILEKEGCSRVICALRDTIGEDNLLDNGKNKILKIIEIKSKRGIHKGVREILKYL